MEAASTDLFINIIQNHKIIYDTTSKDFKNVNKKEDEWVKIAEESKMSVDAAKKRYQSLRQKFSREKKKEIMCARNKETFRPSVFHDRLTFLDDFIKPRRTYTNDYEYADQNDAPTRRRNMNDLSNEEYGHIMLYGEPYSLAEEEAMDREALEEMRAEGLIPDDSQMSADDNETPAEINLEQNSVCLPTTEGPQPDVSSDHTYSLDVISPVNQANETLRLRSILPADEQEYYQGSYSLDVISSMNQANETFRRSILPPDEQEMYESPDGDRRRVQARNILQKNLQPPANFRNLNDLIENGNDIRNHRQSSTSQQNRYIPESIHITEHVMQTGMPSTGREHSSSVGNGSLEIRRDAVNVLRPVPQTTVQPVRVETSTNQKRAQATVTSSTLSKNSPLVQAAASVRQQEKSSAPNQSSGKGNSNSLDAIKEKMESYLTACNEKLQKKPERSPHAGFLSYLGSKMEKVAKERIEALEHDILDLVFRFTNEK